jgi:uncharacterized membrane protein YphA (DoxX/SURF4 family)
MNAVNKLENWADHHHPVWLDFIRMLLGLLLIIKGVSYVGNSDLITASIQNSKLQFLTFVAADYVVIIHLIGGFLIAIGLITRVSCLFELPILIAAVFFVNFPKGFSAVNSELSYSIIILCLLVFFLLYGSGPISVDNVLRKTKGKFE